ncbi:MAG: cytidylyltransferase domain-containing protein [Eubacterium sp.]
MKVVAFIPIKLNSVRLKNKNILEIAGHPLCWHIANTLLSVKEIDEVYVYCSTDRIMDYMPKGIKFLKREEYLDGDQVKGAEIYASFLRKIKSDIYVLAHATSPFISLKSLRNSLNKVLSEEYDSAYTAKKIQNFVWYKGKTLNYELEDVPRTQDLEPIWVETSAFFIFKRELFMETNRRIGYSPYCQEVRGIETIDVDTKEDFIFAKVYASINKKYE